jgi:hypothetical protein
VNRSLLLVLLCLLAAMPPQVCACDHSDHAPPAAAHEYPDEPAAPAEPHDHDDTPVDDDGQCPCSCHIATRVACATPRVTDDQTGGLEYDAAVATVAAPARIPSLLPTARSGEPPPGRLHPSVPLFLAVSRLLI